MSQNPSSATTVIRSASGDYLSVPFADDVELSMRS